MKDFAAIDFETANYERSSVCSVGVVIVGTVKSWIPSILSSSQNRITIATDVRKCMG